MINQTIEFLYEPHGDRFPELRIRVDGVHDVGRMLAVLVKGNCEHAALAYEIARTLNRTPEGRSTLRYLEGCGGPKLAPQPCEACLEGDHAGCYQVLYPYDPIDGAVCGCYEAGGCQEADEIARSRSAVG